MQALVLTYHLIPIELSSCSGRLHIMPEALTITTKCARFFGFHVLGLKASRPVRMPSSKIELGLELINFAGLANWGHEWLTCEK
jgi:hypothetical protein